MFGAGAGFARAGASGVGGRRRDDSNRRRVWPAE